jgi:putative sterol carrier protein
MAFTNVKEVFESMSKNFNPNAAKNLDVVFQFQLTGDEGGDWHIIVKDGACQVKEGAHESPTVTLTLSTENWIKMSNKQMTGMNAVMTGKLKVKGNVLMAQRIETLFPR